MRLLHAAVAALLIHGAAYWLLSLTAPLGAPEGSRQRSLVEFTLRPPRSPAPQQPAAQQPEPPLRSAPARPGAPRAQAPAGPAQAAPPSPAPPRTAAPAPDLFPRDVLERQAGGVLPAAPRREGGRTINEGNRAALAAEDAARAEREAKERVALWAAEERARVATAQGNVDPAWRQIERELVLGFKPPPATLHDAPEGGAARRLGDRLGSAAGQVLNMWRRGEEGLRRPRVPSQVVESAPGRPVDPSQQNYLGDPEGIGVRAMPMEQQQAALEAWNDPVSWYAVEVEVETDAQGQVTGARVVVPSGRRAFDRFALEEVRRRVAAAGEGLGASVSRWRCEAAYSVHASPSIGLTFDDAMLFSKKARQDFAGKHPLKQNVRTKVTLRWVRPPL